MRVVAHVHVVQLNVLSVGKDSRQGFVMGDGAVSLQDGLSIKAFEVNQGILRENQRCSGSFDVWDCLRCR